MEIKNLSQLKKALKDGHTFEIVEHFNRPESVGQVRCVQVLQTNGMYTGIVEEPTSRISLLNGGKGSWCAFGKASDWVFQDGLCEQFLDGTPIWTIRVLDDKIDI